MKATDEEIWEAYIRLGSQAEAANELGVEKTTISRRLPGIRERMTLETTLGLITGKAPLNETQAQTLLDQYIKHSKLAPKIYAIDMTHVEAENVAWFHMSDVHWGHPGCSVDKVKRHIDWAIKEHEKNQSCMLYLGGDWFELGTSKAPGYEQDALSFEVALETSTLLLSQAAKCGVLKGIIGDGNHGERLMRGLKVKIRPAKLLADRLKVRYYPSSSGFIVLTKEREHGVYVAHAASGARTPGGRINALKRYMEQTDANLVLVEHTHSGSSLASSRYKLDKADKVLKMETQLGVLTRSYLESAKSYALPGGYPPELQGLTWVDLPTRSGEIHLRT